MYKKEACYLSFYGAELMSKLTARGLDEDLALEILHVLVPNEQLYSLDEVDQDEVF